MSLSLTSSLPMGIKCSRQRRWQLQRWIIAAAEEDDDGSACGGRTRRQRAWWMRAEVDIGG
jgi:hypothetical protein